MELEYFCYPSESTKYYDEWVNSCWSWLLQYGIKPDSIRRRVYDTDLAHYATATTDIEFKVIIIDDDFDDDYQRELGQ
jgi:glycyl-tRNA synthetase